MSTPETKTAPATLPGDGFRRRTGLIATAVLVVLLGFFCFKGFRVAAIPTAEAVSWNVVIDDGYYYLQVARNMARGHGATFDRVNSTSGFQPLWAGLLVPIFWFTDDPGRGLSAMLCLATILGALSMVLLYIGLVRLAGYGAALLLCGMIAFNPYFLQILQGGLETPALLVCLSALVAFWAHRGHQILAGDRHSCLKLGGLIGLTVLARTDVAMVLIPFCAALAIWSPGSLRARLTRAAWIALPALCLLVPFVSWAWATQGSPVPVSGLVKKWVAATYTANPRDWIATEQWRGVPRTLDLLQWPRPTGKPETIQRILPDVILPGVALLILLLRLAWSRRARQNRLALILTGSAVLGVTGHGLYIYFIYRSAGHWNYHYFFPFALLYTALIILASTSLLSDLGALANRLAGGRLRPGTAALALALCLLPLGYIAHRGVPDGQARYKKLTRPPEQSFRKSRYDGARFIHDNFDERAVFGSWWAGTLGYFSDRRVVNLDGVINSADYFRRYLKQDKVHLYITDGPITHLVDFFWRDPMNERNHPSWRAFFWEHDKEHIVARLRPKLQKHKYVGYKGQSGIYILRVLK